MSFQIVVIPVTVFGQNASILFDGRTRRGVLVDPGGEAERIYSFLQQEGIAVREIWLTHCHLDHCGGVTDLEMRLSKQQQSEHVSIILYAHALEKNMREQISTQAMMFGLPQGGFKNLREPDVYLCGGETLDVGSQSFRVLYTPGHSPGHVAFFTEYVSVTVEFLEASTFQKQGSYQHKGPVLIAGDTLFAGSIGRTDLPGGDHKLLLRSLREQVLSLPDETLVLPGHGSPTTIGRERRTNPFLSC